MGDLVKMSAGGVELDGFVSVPSNAASIVIHFHGLAGNFYENTFVLALAEELNGHGIGFATVNTRGHDYLADAIQGDEWLSKGAAHTTGEEYIDDILAWTSWLWDSYQVPIVLEGHSASAVSVGAAVLSRDVKEVVACVYISPADMLRELRAGVSADRFSELREVAEVMKSKGEGAVLMPEDALEGYLLDAAVYSEMSTPTATWELFSVDSPLNSERALSIRPSIVIFGECELASDDGIKSALEVWESLAGRVVTIPGASHSYRGHEKELADSVSSFIRALGDPSRSEP